MAVGGGLVTLSLVADDNDDEEGHEINTDHPNKQHQRQLPMMVVVLVVAMVVVVFVVVGCWLLWLVVGCWLFLLLLAGSVVFHLFH